MLATLLSGLASGEAIAALNRARSAAIAYVIAGVAGLCGLGFLVGAAYTWAASYYGSLATALGFGIGFLIIAGLILLIHRSTAGSRAKQKADRRKSDMTAIGVTTALAVLPSLLKGKGGLGVVIGPAAAILAYIIYRENTKPRRRVRDDLDGM